MPRKLQPCGTPAAYERHRRKNERPCDACRKAQNEKSATYDRETGRGKARQRALSNLKKANPKLFQELLRAEQLAEPASDEKARRRVYQAALRELARELPQKYAELFDAEVEKEED